MRSTYFLTRCLKHSKVQTVQRSTPQPEDRRITAAVTRLRAYLRRNKIPQTRFAEANGICRIQLQRVMRGERWKQISVNWAYDIWKATDGFVDMELWRSATAKPVPVSKVAA